MLLKIRPKMPVVLQLLGNRPRLALAPTPAVSHVAQPLALPGMNKLPHSGIEPEPIPQLPAQIRTQRRPTTPSRPNQHLHAELTRHHSPRPLPRHARLLLKRLIDSSPGQKVDDSRFDLPLGPRRRYPMSAAELHQLFLKPVPRAKLLLRQRCIQPGPLLRLIHQFTIFQ